MLDIAEHMGIIYTIDRGDVYFFDSSLLFQRSLRLHQTQNDGGQRHEKKEGKGATSETRYEA